MVIHSPREAMIKALEPLGVQPIPGSNRVKIRFDQIRLDTDPNNDTTLRITFMWHGDDICHFYSKQCKPPVYIRDIEGSTITEFIC